MKKNKFIDIFRISILPFLIYMELFFVGLEMENNKIFNLVSNSFLGISLFIIFILTIKDGLIKRIVTKYNKQLTALTLFISYFLYSDIIIGILLTIFNVSEKNLFAQQVIYIFSSLIFIVLLIIVYKKELKESIKRIKTEFRSYIETGISCYVFGLMAMVIFNFILTFVFKLGGAKNEIEIEETLKLMPIYVVFATSIGAPIIEEMIFRKTFRDMFKETWLYILMSGFIFGILHVIGSYSTVTDFLFLLPYGALGISFAYMYYKTKNILVPMSFHFVHNTILIILQLLVMK